MTAGQVVSYYHGNLSKEVCLDIAQTTRDVLNLTPVPVNELTTVCPLKLEAGKTLCYETVLKDMKNENSCSLVIY